MMHSKSWKWWVCGVLLLATFLNYMDRQALSMSLPEMKRTLHLAEERIGLVEGVFGYAFAARARLSAFWPIGSARAASIRSCSSAGRWRESRPASRGIRR